MRKTAPIGVFDSGLGGLTVFKALARRMPGGSLVHFGATAHVPYGSKSPEAVTRYSVEISRFLAAKGIKLLVVACNTSSAVALPAIRRAVKVPVVGVIEPGARAAMNATRGGRVGVIGTFVSVASFIVPRSMRSFAKRAISASQSFPYAAVIRSPMAADSLLTIASAFFWALASLLPSVSNTPPRSLVRSSKTAELL